MTYGGNSSAAEFAVGNVMEEIHARLNTEHPMTTLEFADKIGRCPLEFQPGERWKYEVSADILAAVVKASGMKYGEFLEERAFCAFGIKIQISMFQVRSAGQTGHDL
ncbi:MAG: serine hydrolase [Ruminococcus sp.]